MSVKNKIWVAVVVLLVIGIGVFIFLRMGNDSQTGGDENFRDMGRGQPNESGGERFSEGQPTMQRPELTDDEISEVKEFFESSPSSEEIDEYCMENRNYCMTYCMEINPEDGYCKNPPSEGMGQIPPGEQ